MGVLKNCPFVFIDIVTFLVLKVLAGFEVDGVPQILPLLQNIDDGGGTPAVNILHGFVLVHAFTVPGKVNRGDFHMVSRQPIGNLVGAAALHGHVEDAANDSGSIRVNNPLRSALVPEVAVNHRPSQVLAGLAFGLKGGADFLAGVTGIPLVHDVAEGGKIIVPTKAVHAVIQGNQPDILLPQQFHDLTDLQIVTSQPGHIFDYDRLHMTCFHFCHHCVKAGTVKSGAGNAVIGEVGRAGKAVPSGVVLQHELLVGNAVALTLQLIIPAQTLI